MQLYNYAITVYFVVFRNYFLPQQLLTLSFFSGTPVQMNLSTRIENIHVGYINGGLVSYFLSCFKLYFYCTLYAHAYMGIKFSFSFERRNPS